MLALFLFVPCLHSYAQLGKKKAALDSLAKAKKPDLEKIKKAPVKNFLDKNLYPIKLSDTSVSNAGSVFTLFFDSLNNRHFFDVIPGYVHDLGTGIHEMEEKRYLQVLAGKDGPVYLSEEQWGKRQDVKTTPRAATDKKAGTKIIYGFHPFWMGNAYYSYDFGLLTRIGYFSYSVNASTGGSFSPFMAHSWKNTPLHQKAHAAGCKVDLVVTSYGIANNNKLFGKGGERSQAALVDSLMLLLNMTYTPAGETASVYRGDGITLDLQGFASGNADVRQGLTSFVKRLRAAMDATRKEDDLYINMVLPAWDGSKVYEFDSLATYVNLFIVSGYDYYFHGNNVAGPSSVLVRDTSQFYFTLDHSINYYLDKGVPRETMILSLPWYGKEMSTEGSLPYSPMRPGTGGATLRPYRQVQDLYAINYQLQYDPVKNSGYYPVRDEYGWKQCWTSDTLTLGIKYDYINKKGLGGTGIWALGYENGYNELWDLLQKKFANGTSTLTPTDVDIDSMIAINELDIEKQRSVALAGISNTLPGSDYPAAIPIPVPEKNYGLVAMFCLVILLIFALAGFVIALFYESVREVIFSKEYFIYIVSLALVICIILLLRYFRLASNVSVVFITGALLGGAIVIMLFRRLRKKREEGPTP